MSAVADSAGRLYCRLATLVLVGTIAGLPPDEPTVRAADPPLPTGRRLKEIMPIDGPIPFLIGGTINEPHLGTAAEVIGVNAVGDRTIGSGHGGPVTQRLTAEFRRRVLANAPED